jgi:predicted permease
MSILSDLVERARSILFRRRDERELQEELEFHVDMQADELRRAGATTGEARRRASIALGGVERVKEEVRDARGTRLLFDGSGDVAFALRTLARSPGFSVVAILTLAIGIGGTTAVFSAVDAVLLQPLPYAEPGQLVRLYQADSTSPGDRGVVTPVHFLDYREDVSAFASTAAVLTYSETGADIGTGDAVRRIRLLPVSADYFDVVRVPPTLGRGFAREEETGAPLVVLSHRLWTERFRGDRSAIGRTLVMSGKPYTVVGVMPDGFADPIAGPVDAWVPLDLSPGREEHSAGNHYLSVIARLRPGTSLPRAPADLDALGRTLAARYPNARRTIARLYPLKEDIVGGSSRALELMLGAVVVVLELICVNIANLLLVRGSERAREYALRSALGAARGRLARQTLVESLVLVLAGDIAGVAVARLAMSGIVALAAGSIPRLTTLTLEPRLLAFSLAIASLSALGFGLAPALRAARTDPSDALREQGRGATGGRAQLRLREWLVVAQVALAFVLLAGTGVLLRSVQQVQRVGLGVRTDGVLAFELHLPEARYDSTARARFYEEVAARMEALPGVRAAGGVSRLPATGDYHVWDAAALSGPLAKTERGFRLAQQRIVSGDYFATVGIPLVAGRLFDARDDPSAPPRVVISRGLAEQIFPGVSAVGQRLQAGGIEKEVIGVVGEVAVDPEGKADGYVYHAHRQFAGDRVWSLTQVVRTTGSLDALEREARGVLRSLDPQLVMFRPMPLAEAIGRGEAQRVFTLRILTAFALIALAVAALGLFGVLSYGVRLRVREFGIRMALGAERGSIRRMVLRQGLAVTAIGSAFGVLGAVALSRVLASMVFRASPLEPVAIAGAAAFLAVVAAIASYVPARRATAVDPRSVMQ